MSVPAETDDPAPASEQPTASTVVEEPPLVGAGSDIEPGQPYTDFHRIDDADHRVSIEVPTQWMNLSSPAYNGAISFEVVSSPNPDTPQGVEPPFFKMGAGFFHPEDAVPLAELEDTAVQVLEGICADVTEPNPVEISGYEGNARLATGCQTVNAPAEGTAQLTVNLLPSSAPDHVLYLSLVLDEVNLADLEAAEHALETVQVNGEGLVFPPGL